MQAFSSFQQRSSHLLAKPVGPGGLTTLPLLCGWDTLLRPAKGKARAADCLLSPGLGLLDGVPHPSWSQSGGEHLDGSKHLEVLWLSPSLLGDFQ